MELYFSILIEFQVDVDIKAIVTANNVTNKMMTVNITLDWNNDPRIKSSGATIYNPKVKVHR